ncbi:MAG: hexulose-6-phosphate isomerase [Planctomycetota bacterium]|nr:MAG: hexulose-6-phosphate isomerase [Planctomycetota bacterium]
MSAPTQLGACSWSFRPAGPEALADALLEAGLERLQLGLKPLATAPWRPGWSPRRTQRALRRAGLQVLSGMVGTLGQDLSSPERFAATGGLVSDEHWPRHQVLMRRWARLGERWELPLVSLHVGCAAPDDASARERLVERVALVAREFARHGARLALETGQESPDELLALLREVGEGVGLNLDPANFLLHASGDPLQATRQLAPRALQVHLKDADPPDTPGTWGRERAFGSGAVPWAECLTLIRELAPAVPLMIEREFGEQRVADVRLAAQRAHALLNASSSVADHA